MPWDLTGIIASSVVALVAPLEAAPHATLLTIGATVLSPTLQVNEPKRPWL
jgi:hypothetical protein